MHDRRRHSSASRDRRHPANSHRSDDVAWLTIAQLSRRWQLGRKTIYKFIDAKLLPAWRVGRRLYRVAVADVVRFEAHNKF